MNKHITRTILSGLLLALLALVGRPVDAQGYSFAVPELTMQVFIQPDASAHIVYAITFENHGQIIDIVDVGLPHRDYNLNQMSASINGHPLTNIRKSSYIDVGVEIHLGGHAIPRGERGTLHFETPMPNMVYQDTTDDDLASFQITPTWFDGSLVRGTGDLVIQVILPEGVALDDALYQDVAFTGKRIENGQVLTEWRFEGVSITRAYRVGVSFPKTVMERVETMTFWRLVGDWFTGAFGALEDVFAICMGCSPFIFIFLVFMGLAKSAAKAGKPNYLPPIAEVEGGGIKRGLTAPESAALLELPLNKVLMLVLFGMLEKGLVRVHEAEPLTVLVAEAFETADKPHLQDDPAARSAYRRDVARRRGTIIHKYEDPFLDLLEEHAGDAVNTLPVVDAMKTLVDGVAAKMQGFSLTETREYYQRVIERAMAQAAELGEVEARQDYLDKYLPWVMMNPNYRPVVTVGRYHYWPRWARTTPGGGGRGVAVDARGAPSSGHAPTFRDVAGSFAGWSEKTMGGMAAAIMPTALQKPAPPSTSYSSGGSSCACACAGCACACACAGGGR